MANRGDSLRKAQRDWATRHMVSLDEAGYCTDPTLNLPWLTEAIRADFDAADGQEFGSAARRGKIAALHSSSALAVNFFGYWVEQTRRDRLAKVLPIADVAEMRFEQKFPTGVGPRSPNLDVVLYSRTNALLAIESKYCESFGSPKKASALQDKYFPKGIALWTAVGLSGAQNAAETLRANMPFRYLDAPQLLKHLLGLGNRGGEWHLMLLWYVPPDLESEFETEAREFRHLLRDDGSRFSWMAYQRLWSNLQPLLAPEDAKYESYIAARYFPQAVV